MDFPDYKMRCAKEEALQNYLQTSNLLEDVLNSSDNSLSFKLQRFIILKKKGENEEADLIFDDFIKGLSKDNNDFEEEAYKALYNEHQENLQADKEFWEEEAKQSSY